jgi:hypothetical protein
MGAVEVLPTRLLLDKQDAAPNKVYVTILAVNFLDAGFKCGESAARHAKDIEKFVEECFPFGVFGNLLAPLSGEFDGAIPYLVPGNRHLQFFLLK